MAHEEKSKPEFPDPSDSALLSKEPLRSGTKALIAAQKAGLPTMAAAIASDVALWCASGYSEEEWREEIAKQRQESPEAIDRAVAKIKQAGLWPWKKEI